MAKKHKIKNMSVSEPVSSTCREELYQQRISDGVNLFMLLDLQKRLNIKVTFSHSLDETITDFLDAILGKNSKTCS